MNYLWILIAGIAGIAFGMCLGVLLHTFISECAYPRECPLFKDDGHHGCSHCNIERIDVLNKDNKKEGCKYA